MVRYDDSIDTLSSTLFTCYLHIKTWLTAADWNTRNLVKLRFLHLLSGKSIIKLKLLRRLSNYNFVDEHLSPKPKIKVLLRKIKRKKNIKNSVWRTSRLIERSPVVSKSNSIPKLNVVGLLDYLYQSAQSELYCCYSHDYRWPIKIYSTQIAFIWNPGNAQFLTL